MEKYSTNSLGECCIFQYRTQMNTVCISAWFRVQTKAFSQTSVTSFTHKVIDNTCIIMCICRGFPYLKWRHAQMTTCQRIGVKECKNYKNRFPPVQTWSTQWEEKHLSPPPLPTLSYLSVLPPPRAAGIPHISWGIHTIYQLLGNHSFTATRVDYFTFRFPFFNFRSRRFKD